jgi:hypothetical protein
MKKVGSPDSRFVTITDAEIRSLYRRVPRDFMGAWRLEITWKDNDNDLFNQHISIEIDQRKFNNDILELNDDNSKRIYFTHGMTDIDMFFVEDKFVIYYSISDGSYIYFYFSKKEFDTLVQWIKLEMKNDKGYIK